TARAGLAGMLIVRSSPSRRSDRAQPLRVAVVAATDHVEEQRLQLLGDRSAAAFADRAVVELADRRDLGGGSGEEGFVGAVHLVARDALLAHLDAEVASQRDDRIPRDPVEARR